MTDLSRPAFRQIEVIGHGGAAGFFPGNSAESIRKAIEIGVDRIEIDLLISGDGELLVTHDDREPLGNRKSVAIRDLSTSEIRRYRPALLTFAEVLDLVRDYPLLLDLKKPGFESELIAFINKRKAAAQLSVCTTYARSVLRLRDAFPEMRLALSTAQRFATTSSERWMHASRSLLAPLVPRPLVLAAHAIGAQEVMIKYRLCTARTVAFAHRHDIRIYSWTVDRPADIARLAAAGVDGITSNRPDLVFETLGLEPIRRQHPAQ